MASVINGIKFSFRHPDTDKPLSFGKVYTYDTNTTSERVTYKDEDKTILNTNPVILDAFGQANISLDGKYRIVVCDQYNVQIDIIDPLSDTTTQLRGLVGDVNGLGSTVLYNAGVEQGECLIIGDGTSMGKGALYPELVNPDFDLNTMPLKFKLWHGSNLTNAPTVNHLTILQMPNTDGTITQIAIDQTDGMTYVRNFTTSWSDWGSTVGTLNDFTTALG